MLIYEIIINDFQTSKSLKLSLFMMVQAVFFIATRPNKQNNDLLGAIPVELNLSFLLILWSLFSFSSRKRNLDSALSRNSGTVA
jgi:hypothetical protein